MRTLQLSATVAFALATGTSTARAEHPDLKTYAVASHFFATSTPVTVTFLNSPASDLDFNDLVFSISDVSTTAPEPATMALLALGLVGMSGVGLIRRRSRRR